MSERGISRQVSILSNAISSSSGCSLQMCDKSEDKQGPVVNTTEKNLEQMFLDEINNVAETSAQFKAENGNH